jgi:hypothetical protein
LTAQQTSNFRVALRPLSLQKTARVLKSVDPTIRFTILAFFPAYRMKDFRDPSVQEMVHACESARSAGLTNVRLGNAGVCVRTDEGPAHLEQLLDPDAFQAWCHEGYLPERALALDKYGYLESVHF